MRVAFFGGTFDPIHCGHLRLATAAADAFSLDRVLFAPVGHQPLKAEPASASFVDRVEMAGLALTSPRQDRPATSDSPDPRFAVSLLDAPRPDGRPNYTIDTLAALRLVYPAATLYVLTGADSFLDLRRWRCSDQLLAVAEWIVVSRPEFPLTDSQLDTLALTGTEHARIHLLTTVHEDISSTDLRRRLRTGDRCPGLLPASVAAYIQSHRLYR